MKKKLIILVLAVSMVFVGCGSNKKNETTEATTETTEVTTETTEVTTEESVTEITTTEEIIKTFDDVNMVDYLIVADIFKDSDISYWGENVEYGPDTTPIVVTGYELFDLDNDGIQELIMSLDIVDTGYISGFHQALLTFDSNDGIYSTSRNVSAAGDSQFYVDESNGKVYMKSDYATKYTYIEYDSWNSNGWKIESLYEKDEENLLNCYWEGTEVTSDEWLEKSVELSACRGIKDDIFKYSQIDSPVDARITADTIIEFYKNNGVDCTLLECNGEYYILFSDYENDVWSKKSELDTDQTPLFMTGSFYGIQGVIIKDTEYGSCITVDKIITNYPASHYDFEINQNDNSIILNADGYEFIVQVQGDEFVLINSPF